MASQHKSEITTNVRGTLRTTTACFWASGRGRVDRETAIWALVNNPLVGSYPAAAELVDRLGEAHRAYLPPFAH